MAEEEIEKRKGEDEGEGKKKVGIEREEGKRRMLKQGGGRRGGKEKEPEDEQQTWNLPSHSECFFLSSQT